MPGEGMRDEGCMKDKKKLSFIHPSCLIPQAEATMHPQGGPPAKLSLPGVKFIVAVASGKGGVGKSTVATNLALALQMQGKKVGLLDADIYGPSIPTMMGVPGVIDQNTTALPLDRYGMKLLSMGFFVPVEKAMIWRGPMIDRYLTPFLAAVDWG